MCPNMNVPGAAWMLQVHCSPGQPTALARRASWEVAWKREGMCSEAVSKAKYKHPAFDSPASCWLPGKMFLFQQKKKGKLKL